MEFLNLITKGHAKEINITLSLEIFAIAISLFYLLKIAMEGGVWKSDESKIALFLGFQAWMISFVLLYITPNYVDLQLPLSFEMLMGRVNEALKSIDLRMTIGYEHFCVVMSTVACLITVAQTRHAISFTYYYHMITTPTSRRTVNFGNIRISSLLTHVPFILPMFIIVFYIPALLKDFAVPTLLSDFSFSLLRVLLSLLYVLLKLRQSRTEMQWSANLSYSYLARTLSTLDDGDFGTMTRQMLAVLNRAWTTVLGYFACALVPLVSCVLVLHRGTCFFMSEQLPPFNFDFLYEKTDESEGDSATTNTTAKVNPFALGNIAGIASEVNSKGLIPPAFYRSAFGFVLGWWTLSYFAISLFALVYFRRSPRVSSNNKSD